MMARLVWLPGRKAFGEKPNELFAELASQKDLGWRGVGVNRKEPASVSVPTGPPSQRFHNPTTNKGMGGQQWHSMAKPGG